MTRKEIRYFGSRLEANLQPLLEGFYLKLFRGERDLPEKAFDGVYPAILFCSCRYKHWGFEEEKEVRIVAIPRSLEMREKAEAAGHALKPEKRKKHFMRRGTAVPYIELFEGISTSSGPRLPISGVIVGPHSEKDKRRREIEILLRKHGIEAPVSVSEIPPRL